LKNESIPKNRFIFEATIFIIDSKESSYIELVIIEHNFQLLNKIFLNKEQKKTQEESTAFKGRIM